MSATPRPWEVVHEGHRLSVWAEGYGFIHTHEAPEVNTGATTTANANAELIVRAVNSFDELLALAKSLVEWDAYHERMYSEHNPNVDRFVKAAKAAIAKAEKP